MKSNMNLFSLAGIVLCLIFASVVSGDQPEFDREMVIHILFEDRDEAFLKLRPLWLTYEDVQGTWARALATPDQVTAITDLGFDVEILWNDIRDRSIFRRKAMGERWTSYSNAVQFMHDLATDFPNLVRIYNIGQSVQGRSIWVMKITSNPDVNDPDKPKVRMIGNVHGDEYISMEIMLLLMEYLTSHYDSNPYVTELVNTREIWIQPSVNPDGHYLGIRRNANNVDLNRNHGYMYHSGGSGPFSEPELVHFREWSMQNNFSTSLSFHGIARYYNYTWNFTGQDCPDKQMLIDWGVVYTADNGYTITEGYDWYQVNGDTNDWSYGCRGSLDVTIETPGWNSGHVQQDFDENINGILYFIEVAGYGISGVVTDAVTGEPLEASILVHQHPMPVFTDPVAGDFHRPLQAGTYSITVWANGYNPQTITGIIVENDSRTIQNVQLVPNHMYHAMHVAWTQITDYYRFNASSWPAYMSPHNALGPPNNIPASLGNGCTFVYDMGEGFEIIDNPGDDFIIHEADIPGEPVGQCYVYGSAGDFRGPWTLIGSAEGTTAFDLSGTGLSSVRYLRLVDKGGGSNTGDYPGFDLDAITVIMPCIHDGDVNQDGKVTAADAQMAFQIALGFINPTYQEACSADCDGDGDVTAADAQQIFLTVLGSESCVDP